MELNRCKDKGTVTYNVGLCLAVMARREATLTALGGRGLQVRRETTGSHCVCVCGVWKEKTLYVRRE
jgi:hypothetical protein